MKNIGQKPSTSQSGPKHGANPFARALAEAEQSTYGQQQAGPKTPDSQQLASPWAQTGGSLADSLGNQEQAVWQQEQARTLEKQQKKEALKRKLHDRINPVDTTDIFSARENQVKQEIEQLRKELQLLAQDVAKFNKEVETTLFNDVSRPGQEGKYYLNFFHKLRAFIMLLRQKIKSARTWATQVSAKKKKMKKGPGMFRFEGKGGSEKTKTIYDMMHHEVSSARSGG